jgi:ATP-dependent DNA helicase PIF1
MQLDDAQVTKTIFGGKTVVLGGDFRQILPIVPKGGQEDIVSASLNRSHLWQHVMILRLHINM